LNQQGAHNSALTKRVSSYHHPKTLGYVVNNCLRKHTSLTLEILNCKKTFTTLDRDVSAISCSCGQRRLPQEVSKTRSRFEYVQKSVDHLTMRSSLTQNDRLGFNHSKRITQKNFLPQEVSVAVGSSVMKIFRLTISF